MSTWTLIRNSLITASIPGQLWLSDHKVWSLLSIGVIAAYLIGTEILWVHKNNR